MSGAPKIASLIKSSEDVIQREVSENRILREGMDCNVANWQIKAGLTTDDDQSYFTWTEICPEHDAIVGGNDKQVVFHNRHIDLKEGTSNPIISEWSVLCA